MRADIFFWLNKKSQHLPQGLNGMLVCVICVIIFSEGFRLGSDLCNYSAQNKQNTSTALVTVGQNYPAKLQIDTHLNCCFIIFGLEISPLVQQVLSLAFSLTSNYSNMLSIKWGGYVEQFKLILLIKYMYFKKKTIDHSNLTIMYMPAFYIN